MAEQPIVRALTVRFGEPFHLSSADGLSREEQDRLARDRVMIAIGSLMPRRYWGVYDARIAAAASGLRSYLSAK